MDEHIAAGTVAVTIGFRFRHQRYFQRTAHMARVLLDWHYR